MTFIGWMFDAAREQSPRAPWLREQCRRSLSAGYNALGLYLEHRFAYPSAPWAAAPGALTPELVRRLQHEFTPQGLRIVPFLNTLGHMEGFIRTHGGQWLAEAPARYSAQLCPTRSECVDFARGLISDVIDAFDDEWIHIGGDEAWQLGQCAQCAPRLAREGKGGIYGAHYATLCRFALDRGRRPCLWADMLIKHPEAAAQIPRETLLFNWQYDDPPAETHAKLRGLGFEVVTCPALHTYHAAWCDWSRSMANVDEHLATLRGGDCAGLLLTTWEFSCLSSYETVAPLIHAVGRHATGGLGWREAVTAEGGQAYADAVQRLGVELLDAAPGLRRTWPPEARLRHALLRGGDPFDVWRQWGAEACGPTGERILDICRAAADSLPADAPLHAAAELIAFGCRLARRVDLARGCYERGEAAEAAAALRSLDWSPLEAWEQRFAAAGGSTADASRIERAAAALAAAADRVGALEGQTAGRPAFTTIIRPNAHVGDQAAWLTDVVDAIPRPD